MKKLDRAAALAVIFCWVWITPTPALAQLDGVAVNITSPASASTVSGTGSLTVAGVQFKLDGANLGAEDTSAPYEVSWDTTKTGGGSHSLIAVARDLLGRLWTSDPGTVTVFNDATRPTVSITSPSSRSPVSGTITVTASASDNVGVASVQFKLDGDKHRGRKDSSAPYSVSWDTTTVSNGSHALTAQARDAAGNAITSSAVTVTVFNDTSPPTFTITSPSSGSTVCGAITVTASAPDEAHVAAVQFRVDDSDL